MMLQSQLLPANHAVAGNFLDVSHNSAQPAGSVDHDGADALAVVHQVEGLVEVFQTHGVGDHVIDIDLTCHVVIHVAW